MQNSRLEVEAGINNCLLISDSHNSDLTSLTKHALGFLEQQLANQDMRRVLIVSDIEGDELVCDMFYKNLKNVCRSNSVNEIVLLGSELCAQNQRFKIEKKHCFLTTDDFLKSEIINSFKNKAILLKIAPEFSPEKVQMYLQLLPHDTTLEIDFDAMLHNINYFRSKLKADTKLMCMVKRLRTAAARLRLRSQCSITAAIISAWRLQTRAWNCGRAVSKCRLWC